MKKAANIQTIPLLLTALTFIFLVFVLFVFVSSLNLFLPSSKITFQIKTQDILVGLLIYLKTSIDFAIFIGNLMRQNQSIKDRIAIETGTALGNTLGTLAVLGIWAFFKEIPLLMSFMIIIASLVLLGMASESLNELLTHSLPFKTIFILFNLFLAKINLTIEKFLGKIIPDVKITQVKSLHFIPLVMFSFTIPFILGLDDFAGYIPLFSIINVFGFSIGIFLGHMLLNIALFLNPKKTIAIVRHPLILFIGFFAFIFIAIFGFIESFKLITSLVH